MQSHVPVPGTGQGIRSPGRRSGVSCTLVEGFCPRDTHVIPSTDVSEYLLRGPELGAETELPESPGVGAMK